MDAAVWLGLVRVLRFLKLGSDAGDEVDASACTGAAVREVHIEVLATVPMQSLTMPRRATAGFFNARKQH